MYVRSQKYRYFGHRFSDESTLEMKNFDTHLVFIFNTFNYHSFSEPNIYLARLQTELCRAANITIYNDKMPTADESYALKINVIVILETKNFIEIPKC